MSCSSRLGPRAAQEQRANKDRETKFSPSATSSPRSSPRHARRSRQNAAWRGPSGGVRRRTRRNLLSCRRKVRAESRQPRRDVRRRAAGRERLLVGRAQLHHQRAVPRSRGLHRQARDRQVAAVDAGPRAILVRAAARDDRERGVASFKTKVVTPDGKPLETTVVARRAVQCVRAVGLPAVPARAEAARDHAAPAHGGVPLGRQAAGRSE